jgi:SRSO17 transposase
MLTGIPVFSHDILKECGILKLRPDTILDVIKQSLQLFLPHLWRKEQVAHFYTIINGRLSDLCRKTIQHIGLAFENPLEIDNLYHFMRDAKWDEAAMHKVYLQELAKLLSHPDAMITGDGCDIQKSGKFSVGADRQYCGEAGKVENCQASIMVALCSCYGYGILDFQLYMPKSWFDDDEKKLLWKSCRIPEDLEFNTKNVILSNLINKLYYSGMFQAKYVGVDCSFGKDRSFLASLPKELIYFADIPTDTLVFLNQPTMVIPPYSGRGRKPSVEQPSFPPVKVESIAKDNNFPWNEVVLGTGSKGPIFARDKCVRVLTSRDGKPGDNVWLYIRTLDDGNTKYAICNESDDASFNDIRKPALMRWSIEQNFKVMKTNLGMDHYETRTWVGWRRQILLSLIAHLTVMKVMRKFVTTKSYNLETPVAVTPMPMDEYLDAVEAYQNNEPITNDNIQVTAKPSTQVLTIGLALILINKYLIKTGDVFSAIASLIKNNADSFASHSRIRVKQLLEERKNASSGETA